MKRSMARGLGTKRLQLGFGENAGGLLGGVEDTIDQGVVLGNAVTLEPEEDVGFATHGSDLDELVQAEKVRRDTAVDGVGQGSVVLVICLDDGGSMDTGGGAEGVAADNRIVGRDGGVGGGGNFFAIFLEAGEVAINQAHQAKVD